MDLDKASLCEVPEALMYILRYLPLDNSNGDDSEDRDDGKSGAVSRKYFWLSICLCHCPFFLLHVSLHLSVIFLSLCVCVCLYLSVSVCLCVCVCLSLSFPASLLPSVWLSVCLSLCLSVCLCLELGTSSLLVYCHILTWYRIVVHVICAEVAQCSWQDPVK